MMVKVPSSRLAIDEALVADLLSGFIREEITRFGFNQAILALSGGVDSAVVLALAAMALGPSNVTAVLLPYRTSSGDSVLHARLLCSQFGVSPLEIDITPQIDAYFSSDPAASRARRGNKMSRERMTIVYDLSLKHGGLVLGTSNKTELLLGYGTIFGDLASALNPLGDLFKTQVFALGRYLQLPDAILEKPPSADLWEGQADEADLGFSYAVADTILEAIVDQRYRPGEVVAMGFDEILVASITDRVRANQYKRRLPLIAKLGPRTIDRDFRYPRDWGA